MPEWLTPRRRHAYRANPRPAPRRSQVERLLLETDLSNGQIAARLGVTSGAIRYQVACIRRRHGVSDREELRALLRPAQAAPRAAG